MILQINNTITHRIVDNFFSELGSCKNHRQIGIVADLLKDITHGKVCYAGRKIRTHETPVSLV